MAGLPWAEAPDGRALARWRVHAQRLASLRFDAVPEVVRGLLGVQAEVRLVHPGQSGDVPPEFFRLPFLANRRPATGTENPHDTTAGGYVILRRLGNVHWGIATFMHDWS
jgi:hypothetical protein